ncbi:MAG: hypothetical protein ACRCTJ_02810 [Brevinema sp.]
MKQQTQQKILYKSVKNKINLKAAGCFQGGDKVQKVFVVMRYDDEVDCFKLIAIYKNKTDAQSCVDHHIDTDKIVEIVVKESYTCEGD